VLACKKPRKVLAKYCYLIAGSFKPTARGLNAAETYKVH
jgi:hypothetical protein